MNKTLIALALALVGAIVQSQASAAPTAPSPYAADSPVEVAPMYWRSDYRRQAALSKGVKFSLCDASERKLNRTVYAIPATVRNLDLFGLTGSGFTRFMDSRPTGRDALFKRLSALDVEKQTQLESRDYASLNELREFLKSAGCLAHSTGTQGVRASIKGVSTTPLLEFAFPSSDHHGQDYVVQYESGEETYVLEVTSTSRTVHDISGLLFVTEEDIEHAKRNFLGEHQDEHYGE